MMVMSLALFLFLFFFFSWIFLLFNGNKKGDAKRLNFYLTPKESETVPGNPEERRPLITLLKEVNDRLKKGLSSKKTNAKVDQFLQSAGVTWSAGEYMAYRLILGVVLGGLLFVLTRNILFLLVGLLVGYIYLRIWVSSRGKKRVKQFNDGLADMISSLINSLRAGFSFLQAMKAVEEESESPMKEELGQVLKEMQYGSSLEDALIHLKDRMPSDDLDILIQAVLIQRQVGGNLATVLSSIVDTIRERIKIGRQVKTLTAQGKMSGMVIGALPFVLGGIIYVISPSYMGEMFHHSIGIMMLVSAFISGIIGFVLIQKITKVEV